MHSAHTGLSSPSFHRNLAPFMPTMELTPTPKNMTEKNQEIDTNPHENPIIPLSETTIVPTAEGKKVLDPLDQLLMTLQAKADAETKEREEQARDERNLQTPAKTTTKQTPTTSSPFAIANPFASPMFTPEVVKESERAFSAFGLATTLAIDEQEQEQSVPQDDAERLKTKTMIPTNDTEPWVPPGKHGLSNSERIVSNPVVQSTPTSPPIAMSRATAAALGIAYVDNEETVTVATTAVVKPPMLEETVDGKVDGPSQPKEVLVGLVPSSSVHDEGESTEGMRKDAAKEEAKHMESKANEKVRGETTVESVSVVEVIVKEAKIDQTSKVMIDKKMESVPVILPKNEAEPWVPPEFSGLSNSQRIISSNVSISVPVPRGVESKQEMVVMDEEAKNVVAGKMKPPLPVKGKKEDDSDAAGEAMILAEMERILHERQSEKTDTEEEKNSGTTTNLPIDATAATTTSSPPSSAAAATTVAAATVVEAIVSPDISMIMSGLSTSHDQGNKTGSPTKGKTVLSDKAAYVRHISTKYDDMMAIHTHRHNKLIHEEEKQKLKDQELSKQEGQSHRNSSRSRGNRIGSSQSPLKKARALHLGGGAVGYDANVLALAGA